MGYWSIPSIPFWFTRNYRNLPAHPPSKRVGRRGKDNLATHDIGNNWLFVFLWFLDMTRHSKNSTAAPQFSYHEKVWDASIFLCVLPVLNLFLKASGSTWNNSNACRDRFAASVRLLLFVSSASVRGSRQVRKIASDRAIPFILWDCTAHRAIFIAENVS